VAGFGIRRESIFWGGVGNREGGKVGLASARCRGMSLTSTEQEIVLGDLGHVPGH
jgi:hypothetical protein